MKEVLGHRIRHRIQFLSEADGLGLNRVQRFVSSRHIKDLEEIPLLEGQIIIEDLVQVEVRLTCGGTDMLETPPKNRQVYTVVDHDAYAKSLVERGAVEIEVHPNLYGLVWVINEEPQIGEQLAA